MEVREVDPEFFQGTIFEKTETKMKLKKIVFNPPIMDKRDNLNDTLYVGISGRKGKDGSITLSDKNKNPLEMKYFKREDTQKELYQKAQNLLKKYHTGNAKLPSGFLDELFS